MRFTRSKNYQKLKALNFIAMTRLFNKQLRIQHTLRYLTLHILDCEVSKEVQEIKLWTEGLQKLKNLVYLDLRIEENLFEKFCVDILSNLFVKWDHLELFSLTFHKNSI